jgi:hypothetical protein
MARLLLKPLLLEHENRIKEFEEFKERFPQMTHILKLQRLNRHKPTFDSFMGSAISTMCPLAGDETNQPFELE